MNKTKNTSLHFAANTSKQQVTENTITINSIEELIKHRAIMKQDLCRDMDMNHMTLRNRINNPMGMSRTESDMLANLLGVPQTLMEQLIRGNPIDLINTIVTH